MQAHTRAATAQDKLPTFAVLQIGWLHHDLENQAQRIHEDVPFAPIHLLGTVKSPDTARFGRFCTLAVNDAS